MINTNARNAGDGLENVVIIRGGGDLAVVQFTDCIVADTVCSCWNARNRPQSDEWFRFVRQFMMDSLQWKGFFAGR